MIVAVASCVYFCLMLRIRATSSSYLYPKRVLVCVYDTHVKVAFFMRLVSFPHLHFVFESKGVRMSWWGLFVRIEHGSLHRHAVVECRDLYIVSLLRQRQVMARSSPKRRKRNPPGFLGYA